MKKYRDKYRIESNRWKYWDYSAPGQYFITVNIQDRKRILGEVIGGEMFFSQAGKIVNSEIKNIPTYHPRVILDEWVVMPDHIHLIVELAGYDYGVGGDNVDVGIDDDGNGNETVEKIHEFSLPNTDPNPESQSKPSSIPKPEPPIIHWWHNPRYEPTNDEIKQYRKFRRKMIIPKIMGKMKMITSKQINILNNKPGHKNWQSDYHDYVIRNHQSYIIIKNYIINNPKNWKDDNFND